MRRKENFASAFGIQNKNWGGGGVTMHFSEIAKLQCSGKNVIYYFSVLRIRALVKHQPTKLAIPMRILFKLATLHDIGFHTVNAF